MSFLTLRSAVSAGGGDPPGEGVLFNPGDLGAFNSPGEIFTLDDGSSGVNNHDNGTTTLQSTVTRPGGSSKCIRIGYPNDEAGTQLPFPNFAPTPTLYVRWWMMLDENWSGDFPVGLKTPRIFTSEDYFLADTDTYLSSKMLWMKYADDTGFQPDGPQLNPDSEAVWGQCHSIHNLDIGAKYPDVNLDNGQMYVRAGYWYSYEMYLQMNSADGVADGILETRIDRQVMMNDTAVRWIDSAGRGISTGIEGFRSMWFGGNASYSPTGGGWAHPGITLYRYEDGYYVSTTADWLT
jgi:hypothetical protein